MPRQTRNNAGKTTDGQPDVPTTIIRAKRDLRDPLNPRRQKPGRRNDEGEAMQRTTKTYGYEQARTRHRWLGGKRGRRI